MSCKPRKSKKKDGAKSDSVLEEAKKGDEKQPKVFGAQFECHPPNYYYPQPHPIPCPYYPTMPPPVPPCSLDNENLWDLQFCRWWGWNWVRKKEEFLKQKNYRKCQTQVDMMNEKVFPKKESNKFKNFCLMCKNYCAKRKVREKMDPEKKKEMQWLLDTPCSSCVFYNSPNYDNRSLIFEGNIEYTSDGVAKRSLSTVYVQKGRRRKSKSDLGKYQLCMRRKLDSSSSDESCPCYSSHKYITCSNMNDNAQYLSFQLQSDSDECCACSRRCRCHCPCKVICYPCDMTPKERKKCKCRNMETQTKEPHVAKKFEKGTLACNFKPDFKPVKTVCHCCTCKNKKKYATVCCCKPQEIILCNCSRNKNNKRSISDTDINQKNDCRNRNRKKITIVKSMSTQCLNEKKDQETNMNESGGNVVLESTNSANFIKPINYDDTHPLFRKVYDSTPIRKKDNGFKESSFVSPVSGKRYSLEGKTVVFQDESQNKTHPNPLSHDTNLDYLLSQTLQTNNDEHKELLLEICEAILKARQMQTVDLNLPPLKKAQSLENIHNIATNFADASFDKVVVDSTSTIGKTFCPTVEIFTENFSEEPIRYSTVDPVFREAYEVPGPKPNDAVGSVGENRKGRKGADVNSYFKNDDESYELYPVYKTKLDLEKRIQLYLRMPPQPPPSLTKYFPNYHNLLQCEETVQTQTGESLEKFEELINLNVNEATSVNEVKEDKLDNINLATSTNMAQPKYSEKILSALNLMGEDASTSMNTSDFVIGQHESTICDAISTQSAGIQFQTELASRGTSPNLDCLKQNDVNEKEPLKRDTKTPIVKRVSPFSTFCRPVPDKNIPDQNSQCSSLSRPRRRLLLDKKGLKERERRWRY